MPGLVSKRAVVIDYTNHRGERALRRIRPTGEMVFTHNHYHPEPQWIVYAIDLDKKEERGFALKDIHASWPADELVPRCLFDHVDSQWHAIRVAEDEGSPFHYKRVVFACTHTFFTSHESLRQSAVPRRPTCPACARELAKEKTT